MNEWGVFLVLVSIVSFIGAVASLFNTYIRKPYDVLDDTMKHVNVTLTKLNTTLDYTNDKVNDHETRIREIEKTHYKKDRI